MKFENSLIDKALMYVLFQEPSQWKLGGFVQYVLTLNHPLDPVFIQYSLEANVFYPEYDEVDYVKVQISYDK